MKRRTDEPIDELRTRNKTEKRRKIIEEIPDVTQASRPTEVPQPKPQPQPQQEPKRNVKSEVKQEQPQAQAVPQPKPKRRRTVKQVKQPNKKNMKTMMILGTNSIILNYQMLNVIHLEHLILIINIQLVMILLMYLKNMILKEMLN